MSGATTQEYKKRQADGIRSVQLDPSQHERLRLYASDNQMSVSEALREVLDYYVDHELQAKRKRRSKRVTFWIAPERYLAFTKKLEKANKARPYGSPRVTISEVVETVLGEIL